MKADGGKGWHDIASSKRIILQTGDLRYMINKLLGIQFNIEKARLDVKVQKPASYINEKTLTASVIRKLTERRQWQLME